MTSNLRPIGWLTIASALAGTALAALIMAWPDQVPDTQWSYPFAKAPYIATQVSFSVHDLTLLPGLWVVAALAWRSATRATRAGLALTVASMVFGAVIEAAAITAADATADSGLAGLFGGLYGVLTLALGVGFLLAGIGFRRRPVFPGAIGRWVYLVLGAWTFFPMLPSLFLPLLWGRITIGLWFLMFAGIGVSLVRREARQPVATPALV